MEAAITMDAAALIIGDRRCSRPAKVTPDFMVAGGVKSGGSEVVEMMGQMAA